MHCTTSLALGEGFFYAVRILKGDMNTELRIAQALLDIQAVGFQPNAPIRFKSGLLSPVYVDNRTFPFHPEEWKAVIIGFQALIKEKDIAFDVVAGIETAGIPHSATLGYVLQKPSVFIRKAVKDHGSKKMIEGGQVAAKKVLLIEDHVTTGGSSLHGVLELRNAGANVTDCLAITSYEFPESTAQFQEYQVKLHTLTRFSVILHEAVHRKLLSNQEVKIVESWLEDPKAWERQYHQ